MRKAISPKAGKIWLANEVKEVINTYFNMLELERKGIKYNKSSYRKGLIETLNNIRSGGSLEFKFMNISGVLKKHGKPFIKGYQPLMNFQKSLEDAVLTRLNRDDQMYKVLLTTEFGIFEDCFTEWTGDNPKPVRYHSIKEATEDIKDFIEEANKIEGNDYSSDNFSIHKI